MKGNRCLYFEERLEQDTWTTFVAFPKPNIAVAATNEEYLREVLARINGKRGERALPENLPEWKYVNRNAAFWAVRHYDKMGASTDPTSPFAAKSYLTLRDDQAIGLTFSFDPDKSKTATVTYLSADKNILPMVQENLFEVEHEPGGREMHTRYREISPGIVEGSYDLDHIESGEVFIFLPDGAPGSCDCALTVTGSCLYPALKRGCRGGAFSGALKRSFPRMNAGAPTEMLKAVARSFRGLRFWVPYARGFRGWGFRACL